MVVEGFVSDKSFSETLLYPSDGRYFTVKLSLTGDVINARPTMVTGAFVQLISDHNEEWQYKESVSTGIYELLDDEFRARADVRYKLKVTLSDNDIFESAWEAFASAEFPLIGEIGFKEAEIKKYVVVAGKSEIMNTKVVTVNINVAENDKGEQFFYRYEFTPHWIYKAPLVPASATGGTCWATDPYYLQDYVLQADKTGGYQKDLFYLETIRNERLFVDFSVLVNQYSLTEDQYEFWNEMQQQSRGGVAFDSPPFNLKTNMHSESGDEMVSGYFGVVREQARRWYFNVGDLSYYVQNTLKKDCTVPFQDPAPECFDCREYSFGKATIVKPSWWR